MEPLGVEVYRLVPVDSLPAVAYERDEGTCREVTPAARGMYWKAERVAPEALVAATHVVREGSSGLGVRWLEAEDGARQAGDLYDIARTHACLPVPVGKGEYRCLHPATPLGEAYADPECEEPLARPGLLAGSVPPFCDAGEPSVSLSWREGAEGAELRWLEEPVALESVYFRGADGCVAAQLSLGGYRRVGDVADPAEFSPVFDTLYGAGPLKVQRWSTEQGRLTTLPGGVVFHDAVRGVDCVAARVRGETGMRCAPYREGDAWSQVYSDTRCTSPLLRAFSVGTADLATRWEYPACDGDEALLVDVFERGEAYSGPIFQKLGSECVARGEAPQGEYLLRGRSVLRSLPEVVERRGR
jgi:hypothetical protein